MRSQPLISVIIPCYNYGHLLAECVGSLFAQTYTNWECIIVDDGSSDNTSQIAAQLSQKDKRIQSFSQKNSGPTVSRNLGLSKAKGEFVQFIDADDLIEPQKFEKQLQVFERNPDCDIVYGSVKYFKSENKTKLFNTIALDDSSTWMKKLSGKGDVMVEALLRGNIMVISSPLVRKSLFEKFGAMSEDLYYNEDWELWVRFALGGAAFKFDDSPGTLALVRVHDSYSKDNFNMYIYGLLACLKINQRVNKRKHKKILIPAIAYHKRVIDSKLLGILKESKKKAIEKTNFIYKLTGISRYTFYTKLFKIAPYWMCYAYTKIIFVAHKLKNVIVYA